MAGLAASLAFCAAVTLLLLVLYCHVNDRRLKTLPPRLAALSKRVTAEDVRKVEAELSVKPKDIKRQLPAPTGRRYIVVGGGGFLGGWIVTQLLDRGEDPKRIRVLDINTPVNFAVSNAIEHGLQFLKTDVTDAKAIDEAFSAPWNDKMDDLPGTSVFHTAANIRFYERHPCFLPRSTKVNVEGTRNVINASRLIGADVLVYTSSGSVGVKSTRMLLWPWEKEPKDFVQLIDDDDSRLPKSHWEYFSNYAVTKHMAETLVRKADKTPLASGGKKLLRTGCIRPGNGVFGPRGDMLCGAYLVRQSNPTWIEQSMQSFSYVENCALSHLLYERRLIDLIEQDKHSTGKPKALPDIGGQAFCIADPGPTPTFGDAYVALETLSDGECRFSFLSPTGMHLLANLIEFYYIFQYRATSYFTSRWAQAISSYLLRPLTGDIINLQPTLFKLTGVHLIFDDSRARLSQEKGGLGYEGAFTTLEGLCRTWEEHANGMGRSDARSSTAGVSFGLRKRHIAAKKEVAAASGTVAIDGINLPVGPVEVHAIS